MLSHRAMLALGALVAAAAAQRDPSQIEAEIARLQSELQQAGEAGDGVPRMQVQDGNLNIRLPRQASMRVTRSQDIDIGDLEDRVQQLEIGTVPGVAAHAETIAYQAAFNASLTTMAQSASQIAALQATVAGVGASVDAQMSALASTITARVDDELSSMRIEMQRNANNTLRMVESAQAETASLVSTLSANVSSVAERPGGMIIGYTQCNRRVNSGADSRVMNLMTCAYTKKRDDTVLRIALNSNQRQINGHSRWRIQLDGRNCYGPNNQALGQIYTAFHGSRSIDLHRPVFLEGFCWRKEGNQPIPAGRHVATYQQYDLNADSYFGWESTSRLVIEEWMPEVNSYQQQ